MPSNPYNPVLDSLLDFPDMILPYFIFTCWIGVFFLHMKRLEIRVWSGKILICLSILLGVLATLKFAYGMLVLHNTSMWDGSGDPAFFCE